MPTQKPAPKAGPGRAREVSRVRRRRGPQAGQQQRRPPVSALGGTPPAPPSRRRGGAGQGTPPVGTYYCPRCSPRCPHCSGELCREGTRAPMPSQAASRAWEVPPLMRREITFPPGEWPPLSQSSPAPARADRRPDRRPARTPARPEPPPGRPHKRRRHNRRPEASQGRPPTPPVKEEPPTHPGGRRRNRPGAAQRRRRREVAGRVAVEADPPVGAGPSFAAPDPASLLNQLLGMTDSERGLLQLVAPLLALPSSPGQGDPPPGPEDALTSGPPAGAPDPPSLNRGCPPPGREDALVDCPPLETPGSTSVVDPHPPEAMETSVAGDPPAGIAGPLSPPAEELVGVDSHMHLDRCFSRRHGFGCSGRTLSDLRQHVVHLTGEEPSLRLRVVIANFCDERQWSKVDLAVLDPAVYHTIGLHPRAAGLADVRDRTLTQMRERLAHPQCVALGEVGIDLVHQGHVNPPRDCTQCVRQAVGLLAVLSIMHDTGLPLVIHCRAGVDNDPLVAHRRCYGVLVEAQVPRITPIHLHSFTGTQECWRLWKNAFPRTKMGISGVVFRSESGDLAEAIEHLAWEDLLLESDAPHLVPVAAPWKARTNGLNHPWGILEVAEEVARIRGVGVHEVLYRTQLNACSFYGIPL